MPSLILKNVSAYLHSRLKESARRNRRSLNNEILARLEIQFTSPVVDPGEIARELKALTGRLPFVDHRMVDRYKRKELK
jgi:hypothetical protein